eukprot:10106235-Lingulodinium_polyedra.AAC.1
MNCEKVPQGGARASTSKRPRSSRRSRACMTRSSLRSWSRPPIEKSKRSAVQPRSSAWVLSGARSPQK